MNRSSLGIAASLLVSSVVLFGCSGKPDYPKCEKDEHCAEKGEICVNQTCQECRDDVQCVEKHGDGHECVGGKCEVTPECRTDEDCVSVGDGLVCRSNKCVPECTADEDCGSGQKCDQQKCVAECQTSADCVPPEVCTEYGACEKLDIDISQACMPISGSGDLIQLATIPFDFNEFEIRFDAREALDQNADCLRENADRLTIALEGHADERGTQEYNLALGEKRAAAVRNYLRNLGIDANIMTTRSLGENRPVCREESESCHERNRRVEFIQSRR